ncbi:ribbon-helix-helix domain-containing protein [Hymenobacter sp. NST-14]|uniref:ribbon-helix-helix domain-containing protein n=1 Tax=Hymenobacter piscis TaxID=2839984 RepID=UPI001C02ADD3|nr:CopG family transcriptional regulator [Hymenobacter piscis]MBT9395592.1 ribbon-helix-helix domain-containing protein [Hymenobacter piscis]
MTAPVPSPAPAKKQRAPGRPKAAAPHNATIQLRLDQRQLAQVTKQAQQTGLSRSAIIRAALDGVQVLQAAPTAEQREQYRQLVKLATNLNQLVVLARVGQDVQQQARTTLDQVQQLLATLHQGAV